MASLPELEFFYDCSSPWTYLAFARVIPLMEELELAIRWRPIFVGGVFNAVNKRIYAAREGMFANEQRLAYYFKDMKNWSEFIGIKVEQPDVFPVNSVKAMRGAFFAAIVDQRFKDLLRNNTEELISRGGYGSPTMYINGKDMYFGNDRLPLVEHRLRQLLSA